MIVANQHFLPRIRIPVLMVNGRRDAVFPYATSQEPLFELLGTPREHKHRLIIAEAEHGGWLNHEKPWETYLDFLHRYTDLPLDR